MVPAAENMDLDLSVHPSGIVPQLQNVVATVNLGVALDLKAIALHARNAEYNPKVCAECSNLQAYITAPDDQSLITRFICSVLPP